MGAVLRDGDDGPASITLLDEVLSQLFETLALVRREGLPPITNIVFMGW